MRARPAILAVMALAVAVALFFVLKEDDASGPPPRSAATSPEAADEREGRPEPKPPPAPAIQLASGQPRGGIEKLEVKSGERVQFDVTSDVADEVHVHGYDLTEPLPAGKRVEIRFPATLEGAFEVESHSFGTQIAELTVSP